MTIGEWYGKRGDEYPQIGEMVDGR